MAASTGNLFVDKALAASPSAGAQIILAQLPGATAQQQAQAAAWHTALANLTLKGQGTNVGVAAANPQAAGAKPAAPNYLLYGGIGVAALLVLMMVMKKKR